MHKAAHLHDPLACVCACLGRICMHPCACTCACVHELTLESSLNLRDNLCHFTTPEMLKHSFTSSPCVYLHVLFAHPLGICVGEPL